MYILFTQSSQEWNKEFDFSIANALCPYNMNLLREPLLNIRYFSLPVSIFQREWAGIFVTSQHAVWALHQQGTRDIKKIPLWCVGVRTADLAKNLKFQYIHEGPGSVRGIQTLFLKEEKIQKGDFLYMRGQEVRGDLLSYLRSHGYYVEEQIAYEARPLENFSLRVQKAFQEGIIKGTCLFSIRGAQVFFDLLEKNAITIPKENRVLFCLTSEIADFVKQKGFQPYYEDGMPSLENLLRICRKYFMKNKEV